MTEPTGDLLGLYLHKPKVGAVRKGWPTLFPVSPTGLTDPVDPTVPPVTDVSAPVSYAGATRLVTLDDVAKLTKVTGPAEASVVDGAVRLTATSLTETVWGFTIPQRSFAHGFLRMIARIGNRSNLRWFRVYVAESRAALEAGNYRVQTVANAQATQALGYFIGWSMHPGMGGSTGTVDLTRIGYVQFRTAVTDTSQPAGYVDMRSVDYQPNGAAKAKVVIWHDDGGASAMSLQRMLAPYGWAATLAPNVERFGTDPTALTVAQVQGLQNVDKWQVGTHANSNSGHTGQSGQTLLDNFAASAAKQAQLGLLGGRDFAWWGNQGSGSDNYEAVKATFRSGRYNRSKLDKPETLPPADPWLTTSWLVGASDTTQEWIDFAEEAIGGRGLAQLVFHNDLMASQLEPFLSWLNMNRTRIEVVTIERALTGLSSVDETPVDPDPLIVPPESIVASPRPGGGYLDWNDVPAFGNFGRYDYQLGSGPDNAVVWDGTPTSSGYDSFVTVLGLDTSRRHVRVRSVTTGGRLGAWSTVVAHWTPEARITVPDTGTGELGLPTGSQVVYGLPTYPAKTSTMTKRVDGLSSSQLHPNSAAMVQYIVNDCAAVNGGTPFFNGTQYNTPVYVVGPDVPEVHVGFRNEQNKTSYPKNLTGPSGNSWDLPGLHFMNVPIPSNAIPAVGTDSSLAIWQPSTNRVWEFWRMRIATARDELQQELRKDGSYRQNIVVTRPSNDLVRPNGKACVQGEWSAVWGGRIDNFSNDYGTNFPGTYGMSASGVANVATVAGWREGLAGRFTHALSFLVSKPANWNKISWPAVRSDGSSSDLAAPWEAQRFRLDPAYDIEGSSMTPLGKMLARAAKEYGLILTDMSYGSGVGIGPESQQTWIMANPGAPTSEQPWRKLMGGLFGYQVLRGFPLNRLQALPIDWDKP